MVENAIWILSEKTDLYYARRNSTAERDPVFDGYTACSDAGNHFGAALIALWNYEQKEGRYRHLCAGCRSTVGTDRSD